MDASDVTTGEAVGVVVEKNSYFGAGNDTVEVRDVTCVISVSDIKTEDVRTGDDDGPGTEGDDVRCGKWGEWCENTGNGLAGDEGGIGVEADDGTGDAGGGGVNFGTDGGNGAAGVECTGLTVKEDDAAENVKKSVGTGSGNGAVDVEGTGLTVTDDDAAENVEKSVVEGDGVGCAVAAAPLWANGDESGWGMLWVVSVDLIDVKASDALVKTDVRSRQTTGDEDNRLWKLYPVASTNGRKAVGLYEVGVPSTDVGLRSINGLLGSWFNDWERR